ncbi:hypothetical protein [Pseudomonas baetica]|uniref:hypothetical protein n=1 Tax=Pseudomonas baetica TaxID=674054 RepID=UPI002405B368|nr:hypothetical protein [Pseudomonas baetica]
MTRICCEAAGRAIVYEVAIEAEACVLQCEITDMLVAEANPLAWSSDWDAQGYREMEFRVLSGIVYDEQGEPSELGRNGCAEIAERYAEFIEKEIWRQYDAQHREIIV